LKIISSNPTTTGMADGVPSGASLFRKDQHPQSCVVFLKYRYIMFLLCCAGCVCTCAQVHGHVCVCAWSHILMCVDGGCHIVAAGISL
jgi:hypothetical protein